MTPPSPLPTPSPEEENTAKKLVKQAIEKTKSTYANTQVLINHRLDLSTIICQYTFFKKIRWGNKAKWVYCT